MASNKEHLIIIENNLEKYNEILDAVSLSSPFMVEIMDYEQLLSSEAPRLLSDAMPEDVYIALEERLYKEKKSEIEAFFFGLFDTPFKNFLPIFTDSKAFISPARTPPCFIFIDSADAYSNALYLNTTLVSLFTSQKTNRRLSQYIADSFKGVVTTEILSQKNREIKELNDELEYKNKIDSLTRLYNRKAIYDFLEKEKKRSNRQQWRLNRHDNNERRLRSHLGKYAVILFDLDDFKQVNDQYGHIIGDDVLMSLGNYILTSGLLRANDIAGRLGGEEFIIVLPETDALNAGNPALRLIEGFSRIKFQSRKNKVFNVTISAGISAHQQGDKDTREVVKRADQALYKAKMDGKNRVVIYEEAFKDQIP